jgi:hypothetical protein
MSATRECGDWVFECDTCGDNLETGEADFSEAWVQARSEGWRAFQVGTEWKHECGDCA